VSVVVIDNRSDEELPLEEYHRFASFVLSKFSLPKDAELAISYVTPGEIQFLNHHYRGVDEATDVLSFECDAFDDEEDALFPGDDHLLGDVIIAPVVAREHARGFGTTFESEMLLMLVHGILHLLGFDHIDDEDYERMRAREDELLKSWDETSVS
jgi:probable rRNA maturation factor